MGIQQAENKYQEKQKRRRGLQKTRFYCQICQRQCLDENGFKCHVKSEIHMKNLAKKLEDNDGNAGQLIDGYSETFEEDFVRLLRITHGEKLIGFNKFYQEYIKDKDHVHLNATRWKSISGLARHLQNNKKCRIVELDFDSPTGERFLIGYRAAGKDRNTIHDSEETKSGLGFDDEAIDGIEQVSCAPIDAAKAALQEKIQENQEMVNRVTSEASPRPASVNSLKSRSRVSFALKKAKK